jgi:hypothetical protein
MEWQQLMINLGWVQGFFLNTALDRGRARNPAVETRLTNSDFPFQFNRCYMLSLLTCLHYYYCLSAAGAARPHQKIATARMPFSVFSLSFYHHLVPVPNNVENIPQPEASLGVHRKNYNRQLLPSHLLLYAGCNQGNFQSRSSSFYP